MPEGDWLCCNDCTRIHSILGNLLVRVAERLPESLLDVIKKKQEEIYLEPLNEIDIRWRLVNGKVASPETRPLLLEALSIFNVSSASPYISSLFSRSQLLYVGWLKLIILVCPQQMVEMLCFFVINGVLFLNWFFFIVCLCMIVSFDYQSFRKK